MMPNAVLATRPRIVHSMPSGVVSCFTTFGLPVSAEHPRIQDVQELIHLVGQHTDNLELFAVVA